MNNHAEWLVAFNEHADTSDERIISALAAYQRYCSTQMVIHNPAMLAQEEGMSLQGFMDGLEEAKKQGWLGQIISLGQAILITLTIPEGLSVEVGSSD